MQRGVYHSTTLIAVALLLLILFVSVAYFFHIPAVDPTDETALAELRQQRALWEGTRPRSFRYVIERSCFCPIEYVTPYIVAEDSGSRSASFIATVESDSGEFIGTPPDPDWIDDIFDRAAEALETPRTATVVVHYDRRHGFPTLVDINGSAPDSGMRYEIRDFEVITPR